MFCILSYSFQNCITLVVIAFGIFIGPTTKFKNYTLNYNVYFLETTI